MGNYPSHLREGPFFFLGGEKKILLSITFRRDPLEKSLKVFKNFFIRINVIKNSSLLAKFLNDKKSRIRCNFGKLANKLASDTPTITRLILFDFLSKI